MLATWKYIGWDVYSTDFDELNSMIEAATKRLIEAHLEYGAATAVLKELEARRAAAILNRAGIAEGDDVVIAYSDGDCKARYVNILQNWIRVRHYLKSGKLSKCETTVKLSMATHMKKC